MVAASGGLILGWGLWWWLVVTMGLVGWVCCGLGWLVVTVGLFLFVILVVGGWVVVAGSSGCGQWLWICG